VKARYAFLEVREATSQLANDGLSIILPPDGVNFAAVCADFLRSLPDALPVHLRREVYRPRFAITVTRGTHKPSSSTHPSEKLLGKGLLKALAAYDSNRRLLVKGDAGETKLLYSLPKLRGKVGIH
jgi:hypothetical protein